MTAPVAALTTPDTVAVRAGSLGLLPPHAATAIDVITAIVSVEIDVETRMRIVAPVHSNIACWSSPCPAAYQRIVLGCGAAVCKSSASATGTRLSNRPFCSSNAVGDAVVDQQPAGDRAFDDGDSHGRLR